LDLDTKKNCEEGKTRFCLRGEPKRGRCGGSLDQKTNRGGIQPEKKRKRLFTGGESEVPGGGGEEGDVTQNKPKR